MNKTRLKYLIVFFLCKLGVLSKKSRLKEADLRAIKLVNNKVESLLSSSNNIFILEIDNRKYFFRECGSHSSPTNVMSDVITKYDNYFGIDKVFYEVLAQSDKSILGNLGAFDDFSSPVYQYFKTGDSRKIGISLGQHHDLKAQLDQFVHYAWSELITWRLNEGGGDMQLFHYNRAKCQEELYRLFGVADLICHSELVVIKGNERHVGSIMDDASGVSPLSLNIDVINRLAVPLLHMNLTTLSIMDVLCYERDHRPGNYNLTVNNDGMVESVCAFDNDSLMTFLPTPSVRNSFVSCSPIVSNKGLINRRGINADFGKRFLNITVEQVKKVSSPYLNHIQQMMLAARFLRLKKAMKMSLEQMPDFFIENNDWSLDVVEEDRKFGLNYYDLLLNWKENSKDEVTLMQGKFASRRASM